MNQNFRNNVIVLHKVLKTSPVVFEDIDLVRFKTILDHKLPCLSATLSFESKEPCLLTTFDDGHKSDIELVLPLLLDRKASASFFIVPSFIGQRGFLTWKDVAKLSNSGMDIGSHSLSHVDFRKINNNKAISELVDSKKLIEDKIGKSVVSFSFPYGFVPRGAGELALASGYTYVFGSMHGIIQKKNNSGSVLPRNSINMGMSPKKINRTLDGGIVTRVLWKLEDITKMILKNVIPQNIYFFLRSLFRW